jgi:tetratricopeptide (TPR) repeat protein
MATPGAKEAIVASLNRKDIAGAERQLMLALQISPEDADLLQWMGAVRQMQGKSADAEQFFRQSLKKNPRQAHVHHNLGNLLLNEGRAKEAASAQNEATRLQPNFVQAHLGAALALAKLDQYGDAERSCRRALQIQPDNMLASEVLAEQLNNLDRPKEAEQILRQMLATGILDDYSHPSAQHNLAIALKKQSRFEEALVYFDHARTNPSNLSSIEYHQGEILYRLGRLTPAFEAFRRALESAPGNAPLLAYAAMTAARLGDFEAARSYGDRAIAADSAEPVALIALALADIHGDDFDGAAARVKQVLGGQRGTGSDPVNFALGFVGDALDQKAKFDAAFDVYNALNERLRTRAAPWEKVRAIQEVRRLLAHFQKSAPWTASPAMTAGKKEAAGHVFILGFMRSGTTLLAAALGSNENVTVADERETLADPSREFLLNSSGLDKLANLGAAECERWRDSYWDAVQSAGFDVAGKVFVDKMPFNALRLPLIARLFPKAKIIFAIRDPRDVVLSCFRRRFDITGYSYEYLRLEDGAQFYADTMSLIAEYRRKLPLDVMEPCVLRASMSVWTGVTRCATSAPAPARSIQQVQAQHKSGMHFTTTPSASGGDMATRSRRFCPSCSRGSTRSATNPPESPALAAVILVHSVEQRGDKLALGSCERRIPGIQQQDDAIFIAIIPRFVVDRIVEHPRFAFAPVARRVADAETTTLRHNNRQMHDQAGIRRAGMCWKMRLGRQRGKHHRRPEVRGVHQRHRVYGGGRAWAARAGFIEPPGILPEEERAPVWGIVQILERIQRHAFGTGHIGAKSLAAGAQNLKQFLSHRIGLCFQFLQPRKLRAVVELCCGQLRYQKHRGRGRIDLLLAQSDVLAFFEPAQIF